MTLKNPGQDVSALDRTLPRQWGSLQHAGAQAGILLQSRLAHGSSHDQPHLVIYFSRRADPDRLYRTGRTRAEFRTLSSQPMNVTALIKAPHQKVKETNRNRTSCLPSRTATAGKISS